MTMFLELTTLASLSPLSDQLSYRALFEEDAKKFSVERMEKIRNKGLYLTSVAEWKISHIIYSENYFERHTG